MAYPCPHCNQPVRRAPAAGGWESGGFLGWLLSAAMADFDCARCGKILREEFSPEVQQQMARGSYSIVLFGAVLAMASTVLGGILYFASRM